ncbi:MAG: hypothetical protein Q8P46_10880 [Hyphomicrobiales bacterium]|nr:hypothetical protein [Hyphomicrobiales bacterium]
MTAAVSGMRVNEAKRIETVLSLLTAEAIDPCLYVGSSAVNQPAADEPFVDQRLFAPLRARGVRVVYVETRKADGVDLVGDMLDESFQTELKKLRPRLILSPHLPERLSDLAEFAKACARIIEPEGFLLIVRPSFHRNPPDPAPTLYRPGIELMRRIFPDFQVLAQNIVSDRTGFSEFVNGYAAGEFARALAGDIVKLPYLLISDPARFKTRYEKYARLFGPRTSAVVLLRRLAEDNDEGTQH